VARTKAEIAEYNRAYREAHADELKARRMEWYEAHRETELVRLREGSAARKERLGEHNAEARRIERNLRVGRRGGLTDVEAWWFALQCEIERNLHGENALRGPGKVAALITAIIEERPVLAKLDAARWAAPTGDQANAEIDDGWTELEAS
jgi:hypothetical protein